jgi:hypothetical protein
VISRAFHLSTLLRVFHSDYDITSRWKSEEKKRRVNIMFSSSMNTAIYSKQTQILLFILLVDGEDEFGGFVTVKRRRMKLGRLVLGEIEVIFK